MLSKIDPKNLCVAIEGNVLAGRNPVRRYLSDLKEVCASSAAYEKTILQGNELVYEVSSVEPANGDGQLHYGLGTLYPGKIGDEYYFTKGHYHSRREAAEVYIGLRGEGVMLLQDERSGESQMVSLRANGIVYVPGYTAHRTANTGNEPLVYLGIYPSDAGHDYQSIAKDNFNHVIVCVDGKPRMINRSEYLTTLYHHEL